MDLAPGTEWYKNPADDLHEGMPVSIQSTTQGTQDKAANSPTGTSVAKEQ